LKTKYFLYYVSLYGGTAFILKIFGLGLFIWLARTLSTDDYARFSLMYTAQVGVVVFSSSGIMEVVSGELKNFQSRNQRQYLMTLAHSSFIPFLFLTVLLVLTFYIGFIGTENAIVIFVIGVGALLSYATIQSKIQRLQEKHINSLCYSFLVPLFGFIGGWLAFYFDPTVQSFFSGSFFFLLISLMYLWILKTGFNDFILDYKELDIIYKKIFPFIVISIFGWLGSYGNNYFINIILTKSDVAKFTFLLSVSAAIQILITAVNQVWSPYFYRIMQQLSFAEVNNKTNRMFHWLSIFIGISIAIMIYFYSIVVSIIGGNALAYQSMELELLIMSIVYVTTVPWWHLNAYYIFHSKGKELMRITLISSLVSTAVWVCLMLVLGPIGIYIGFFMQYVIRTAWIIKSSRRYWSNIAISWSGIFMGLLIASSSTLLSTY
jgi:O-antigen/teichoic acid export membrane protein